MFISTLEIVIHTIMQKTNIHCNILQF